MSFGGAKLAILVRGRVLTVRRDDRPDIPYPGMWDLPGGGREGGESPEECVLRETEEETGLALDAADLGWRRSYPPEPGQPAATWFFVMRIDGLDAASVRLGDEGQAWRLMEADEFTAHPEAVPHLARRLWAYLQRD